MNVEVYFNPKSVPEDALKGKVVVVIDVLRACSTIVTALAHGARAVVPVADTGEATRIADALDRETTLLGGERGAKPIEGYDAGNSPLEYAPDAVAGKTVVLNTSNGTGACGRARGAERVVAGCFLNAGRVVDFLRTALPDDPGDTRGVLLCAGHAGGLALEDTLCAGLLLDRLWEGRAPAAVADGAHVALTQYRHDQHRLARALFGCTHTQRLIALGMGDDVAYCARLDALPYLPVYRDSRIALDAADRAAAGRALAEAPASAANRSAAA